MPFAPLLTPISHAERHTELRKFPFTVLVAQPEEVTADLVPRMLAVSTSRGTVEVLAMDR